MPVGVGGFISFHLMRIIKFHNSQSELFHICRKANISLKPKELSLLSLQHPLSTIEIIPCDSTCTLIVSKDEAVIDRYLKRCPKSEDLSLLNRQ